MAGLSLWTAQNWFNLIQTVGIIGSLWMAAAAANRDAKAKEVENLLTLSEHHRELWSQIPERKELERVLKTDVDASSELASVAEMEFLNLVFVHFQTGWRIARNGGMTSLNEMGADIRGFFTLPLPSAVWKKTKQFRNPKFVRFVERALRE